MKVIDRRTHTRMFIERRCFVCNNEIPLSDGHANRQLGIFVHGRCNAKVRAAARPGRPIREILAELKGDPMWGGGR